MLALRRLAPVAARATARTSVRAFSSDVEVLKTPPSKASRPFYDPSAIYVQMKLDKDVLPWLCVIYMMQC